jgi:hypothetical protein
MKLEKYINNAFKSTSDVDYVDLFLNTTYEGRFTASLALNKKYLALDKPKKRGVAKSYCFPMGLLVEKSGNSVYFEYCGAEFELTFFVCRNNN